MSSPRPRAPRRSRRLASSIPAADWQHAGYDAGDGAFLEQLQRDMTHLRPALDATFSGMICLPAEIPWREWPVRHHELLLPHWEKFAAALTRPREVEVREIFIGSDQLPPPVLETILPSMRNMTMITLLNSGLGSAGLRCLSSFLGRNSTLLKVAIYTDDIDLGAADSLSRAVSNHPTLDSLSLRDCGLDSGNVGRLLDGCGRVKEILFMENQIASAGAAAIADFVGRNDTQTTSISLCDNLISDADVPRLVHSLRNNTALKCLYMT